MLNGNGIPAATVSVAEAAAALTDALRIPVTCPVTSALQQVRLWRFARCRSTVFVDFRRCRWLSVQAAEISVSLVLDNFLRRRIEEEFLRFEVSDLRVRVNCNPPVQSNIGLNCSIGYLVYGCQTNAN